MEFGDFERALTVLILRDQPKKWWSIDELFEVLRDKLSTLLIEFGEKQGVCGRAIEKLQSLERMGVRVDHFGGVEDDVWDGDEVDDFKEKLQDFLSEMGLLLERDLVTRRFRLTPFKVKIRRCKNCGRWFEVKRSNQLFCKRGCKVNHHKKHCDRCRKLERLRKQK